LSAHSALQNTNNIFFIHLPVAVPALHSDTRIILVQSASCNAGIVLGCADLHKKARLRSDTHLSVDTSFCSTNSSATADNRTHVDITLFTISGLRNNFLLGSWNILYVAGFQPISKRRGLNPIQWQWKLFFLIVTKFRMAEVSIQPLAI
jgi:hypothetical protein